MTKSRTVFIATALSALLLSACGETTVVKPTVETTSEHTAEFNAAIAHYRALMTQEPGEIEAILGLARNLRWAGRIDEAATVLGQARARFGGETAFLAELGKVRLLQGDSEDGVALLESATQNDTNDWRLYSALGIGNDYLRRYRQAEAAYAKALEMCPNDAAVMNNLGVSQALSGRMGRAIMTLQDALAYGQYTDQITRNLELLERTRALCPGCPPEYLKSGGSVILAAGLMGTDREGPCTPQPAYAPAKAPVMAEELASASPAPSINIKVYFEFNSAILKPEAKGVLDSLGEALTSGELNTYRFELAGHTDAVGSEAYNQKLSQRRAEAVLNYLVETFQIDTDRLSAIGYGESRLLDPDDPKGDINRRVQVTRLARMPTAQDSPPAPEAPKPGDGPNSPGV